MNLGHHAHTRPARCIGVKVLSSLLDAFKLLVLIESIGTSSHALEGLARIDAGLWLGHLCDQSSIASIGSYHHRLRPIVAWIVGLLGVDDLDLGLLLNKVVLCELDLFQVAT